MKPMILLTGLILIVLGAAFGSPEAAAQEEKWRQDRFYLGFGLYRPNFDTRIRVDEANTGISGTLLNLERDLELRDRKTQFTMDGHFRFAKRHALEFEWVKLKREDETTVGFGFTYDGEFIGIDEDIVTTFNTEVLRAAYRFSFINNDRMELSLALGLHITDLEVGVNLSDETQDPEFKDATAPLPTLGGAWKYHFNDQFTFHIRGEWLDVKIDNVKGSLTAGLAELTWFPARNFGFGLGYHIWDFDVSVTKKSLTGSVDYRYDGPKLSINLRF